MAIKVLIVDDHAMFRQGLRALLQRDVGFLVAGEARDGEEAVELVRAQRPEVVVVDIVMPKLNGIEATRQILAEFPQTRVIALTTHADRRYLEEIFKAGASGYLLKDCAFDELILAIGTVARGESYVSPTLSRLMIEGWLRPEETGAGGEREPLSPREREVLLAVAQGLSSKAIAARLYLSIKTVETHRHNIMEKLDLHTVAELTQYAIRNGMLKL